MEFQPYEYQKVCIQQVMEKPACALWLDMGLGKTSVFRHYARLLTST